MAFRPRSVRWALLAFLGGVTLWSLAPRIDLFVLYCAILSALVFAALAKRPSYRLCGILAAFFMVGIVRMDMHMGFSDDFAGYVSSGVVTVHGAVIKDPSVKGTSQRFVVAVSEIDERGGRVAKQGKIQVSARLLPPVHYGDRVELRCRIEQPKNSETFAYRDYLFRKHISAVCSNASVTVKDRTGGNPIIRTLAIMREHIQATIARSIHQPYAGLLEGILSGARSSFPVDLSTVFSTVGLSHIVAVSGANILIVAAYLRFLFQCVRCSARVRFVGILSGMWLFVFFAGASGATIRAGIMATLMIIAQHIGRASASGTALLVTATVMVGVMPTVLLFDISFQLSFLATAGIIYLGPLIERYLNAIRFKPIQEVLMQTIAATLATAPLSFFYFGTFSVISLVANMLVVPVIPAAMALGALWLTVALPLSALQFTGVQFVVDILSWPVWLMLWYIVETAQVLSRIPFAAVALENDTVQFAVPLFVYILLIGAVFWLKYTKKRQLQNVEETLHP